MSFLSNRVKREKRPKMKTKGPKAGLYFFCEYYTLKGERNVAKEEMLLFLVVLFMFMEEREREI